ncbi:MAG: peptidase [Thermoleophilia bacterium]|jgi:Zn-dependent metalloprotease|nr:peptidase [Thermoleophilia bacterium]
MPSPALPEIRSRVGSPTAPVVRVGDAPPIGDPVVDTAHDNTRIGLDYLRDVHGRSSVDGRGGAVSVTTGELDLEGNGLWHQGGLRLGTAHERYMAPLGQSLDIVVHEMTHGINIAGPRVGVEGEQGAVVESFADVLGETAEQWHENRAAFGTVEGARAGDWLIAEDSALPNFGRAMRDMANPGTAFDNRPYGADPQPGHMKGFVTTDDDQGGVHINSGILNKAAHGAALQLGSEKVAKVWYDTLTTRLGSNADFDAAALATIESARDLYGTTEADAVRDAWRAVGLPRTSSPQLDPRS